VSEPGEVLEEALLRADDGDWPGVAELLRDAITSDPDPTAELLCWLGVAERELGLTGIAYERFKQALALDPQEPFVLATAGNAIAQFDDPEAEPALRAAALLGPDVPLARWMYGAYLTREGMLDEARRELDAALELDPDDPLIRYESAVWYLVSDAPSEGISDLFRSLDLDPEDGWARVVLGLALLSADRVEEAVVELDAGARLREDDVEAQLLAALALTVEGDADRAWEMLERARLRAEGTDTLTVNEVEDRMNDTPEAARRLLDSTLAPSALRERLATRP
jgi:Flp pilus assembly protein TadD